MSLKAKVLCFQCTKILKDPIQLPCKHHICANHLKETKVCKEKEIKCLKCKEKFPIIDNEFQSNDLVKAFLDEFKYLSYDEMILKQQLYESLKLFYKFQEEYIISKNDFDLECYNHFQEIRRQIDLRREELKEKINDIHQINKIDSIALEMIEETKICESSYLINSFKLSLNNTFDEEVNDFNEAFRNPNLSLDLIKEMTSEKCLNINQLKSKLNDLLISRERLKKNQFKPYFDLVEFGQIHLFENSFDPFKSEILSKNQSIDLIKLCEFDLKYKWTLIYRASKDGFGANDFHSKCDGHSQTLSIFKAKDTGFIFGGYTDATWDDLDEFKFDLNAFIFSLTNKENKPCIMKTNDANESIYGSPNWGPAFGKYDISVADNSNSSKISNSDLGFTYKHPEYDVGTREAQSFLAGSEEFQLVEIEVYEKNNILP